MKKFLLLCFSFAFVLSGWAQERVVTGKVSAVEDGSALPGVNVVVKGTTNGTVTNADGKYSLSVPSSGVSLVFSFIGLKSAEITVGERTVLDVQLDSDVTQLSDVVVTAIGIEQNKRNLAYAVQNVTAEDLIDSRQSNLLNALNSKVAGISVVSSSGTPGASAQIRIRGGSSLSRNNEPLFVVDGIPVDNSSTGNAVDGVNQSNRLIDLNPNDIESLTVLKGPAATVQYGIRGSNGVIIVTTKKGKKNQKGTITFSSTTSIDEVNKLPEMQLTYGQGRNGVFQGPASGQGTSWGPLISDLRYVNNPANPDNKLHSFGAIVPAASAPPGSPVARAFDNVGTFFQQGITQDYYVSGSAGNEKSTVYASAGILDQKGIVPTSTFQRYTFKLNGETSITDKLKVTAGVTYTQSGGQRVQQGSNLSGLMLGLLRTPPTFDNSNGFSNPAGNPLSYTFSDVANTDPNNYQRSYRFNYDNPYWTVNNSPFRDRVNRIIGNIGASYQATSWLKLNWRSGIDVFSDFRKESFDIGSKTNLFGSLNENQILSRQTNHDLFLTVDKQLSGDFKLFGSLGYNFFSVYGDRHQSAATTATIPRFFDISNYSTVVNTNAITNRQVHGVYGEARLTWKDMLFVNFSARNDWSSTLPKENNAIFYPSASLGFDVTQAFFKENKTLNLLKIRTSYGSVGNDAPIYSTSNYYNRLAYPDGWTDGLVAPILGNNAFATNGILGNSNLKPELTTTIEIGADIGLFNDRVTIDYTYFSTENRNQILPAQIAATSGFYQTIVNTGRIERTGHEAVVNIGAIRSNDSRGFNWDLTFNFTQYTAVVKELYQDLERTSAGFSGFVNQAVLNKAFPTFYGTRFQRDTQGRVVVDGTSGLPIQAATDGPLGSPIPDWQMGIKNTFSYKGFSLSALFDIRQGGLVWNGTKGVLRGFGTSKATEDRTTTTIFPNSVLENGQPNNIPIALGGQAYNRNYGFTGLDELNIEDGSWVRLREVNFGYNIPAKLFGGYIKSAKISLTARNLFLITNYSGIDPETNLTGSSNDFGEDYFNMPNTRSYGANVTLTF